MQPTFLTENYNKKIRMAVHQQVTVIQILMMIFHPL